MAIFSGFVGLCGGIATGVAMCAILTTLRIYSNCERLCGISGSQKSFSILSLLGVALGMLISLTQLAIDIWLLNIIFALFGGAFVGLLIMSLGEVTDLIPKLYRFLPSVRIITILLVLFALGKLVGALIDFTIFGGSYE